MKPNTARPKASKPLRFHLSGLFIPAARAAALIVVLASCTTTTVDKASLPQALKVQFAPCVPRDGTAELSFVAAGKVVASDMTLDFIATRHSGPTANLKAELSNPLGQTLMTISHRPPSRAIAVTGRRVPKRLKRPYATDDQGFITVDGTSVGLKLTELICALGGVWPKPWLSQLTAFAIADNQARLVAEADGRKIKLTLPLTGAMPRRCAAITVRYALGLYSEQLRLCLDPNSGLGSLSYPDQGQTLHWAIVTD